VLQHLVLQVCDVTTPPIAADTIAARTLASTPSSPPVSTA
jgi:hypothetical protein